MNLGITSNDIRMEDINIIDPPINLTETENLNTFNFAKEEYYDPPVPPLTRIPEINLSPGDTSNTHGHYANNWNENNEKIVDRWLNTVNQNSYIYDRVSDIYLKKHSKIQICLLLFNSLLAIISYLQFNSANDTEILVYKYLIMILSSIVALIVNIQRVKKYETKANDYSSTSLELSALTLIMLSQIEIPYNMRQDFTTYLPKIRQKYYSLLSKLPNMDEKDYRNGFEAFKTFNNTICKQNFRHQLANDKDENLRLQIVPEKDILIDIESPRIPIHF